MSINKKNEHLQQANLAANAPSGEELLDVIATLQAMENFSEIAAHNGGIKQAIKEELSSADSEGRTLSLPHDDAIELFEDMFDAIMNGNEVDEEFKDKILMLKTPLLKRVIMDETFFADRQHPARTLLNQIVLIGGFASTLAPKVLKQLDEIVEEILSSKF